MCEVKKKQKILIIEDDDVFNNVLKKHFEHGNYTVESASNGIDGIRKAVETRPNIIILDADLPTITGYELTKKIKNNDLLKDIPLIMVSTLTQDVNIHKGLNLGVVDFITKPVDIDDLSARIDSHMKGL
jgi:DNA-binding response OmpR family regulator